MFKKRKTPSAEMQRKAGDDDDNDKEEVEETTVVSKPVAKSVFSATAGGIHVASTSTTSTNKKNLLYVDDVSAIAEKKQNQAVLSLTEENEEELLGKKRTKQPTSKFGPSSAPAFVRATTITDYNPELCKDYNQTGYCGYGDSCIYIHDRTTYVSGNVLDKRWDAELQKKKQQQPENKPTADNSTTCGICKKAKDATATREYVKTRCGHVFCKQCAFDRFSEGKTTCEACSAQTLGIFNDIKL